MNNLRWKFELTITGIDEDSCDRILNWMGLVVGGYGGTISGGFVPDEKSKESESNEENGWFGNSEGIIIKMNGEETDGKEDSGSMPDG